MQKFGSCQRIVWRGKDRVSQSGPLMSLWLALLSRNVT